MFDAIAFIGSGAIGATLARLAARAGLRVVVSNARGPSSLTPLVEELGNRARAATVDDAARAGDIVIVSVPFGRYLELPAGSLAGKIVIDTMNYYPHRDARVAELDCHEITSSELVQRWFARSRVVKAMNNLDYRHLAENARPAGDPERSALPIAGDDESAKHAVANLMNAIGYDAVDIGDLREGWRFGPGMPAYVLPYIATSPSGMTEEEQRRWFIESPGAQVSGERVRQLTGAARRDAAIARVPGYRAPASDSGRSPRRA